MEYLRLPMLSAFAECRGAAGAPPALHLQYYAMPEMAPAAQSGVDGTAPGPRWWRVM